LWLNDGSTLRLQPQFAKHVWSYDFMQDRTRNGKTFRSRVFSGFFTFVVNKTLLLEALLSYFWRRYRRAE
jgi:hypothetical protein